MKDSIAEHIRHHGFKRLLLAVSGGLDSICLAHYFICNKDALGIEWLGIAHVHHGLRAGTADRDAAFVEAFAKAHYVPFFLKKLDGEALKSADGSLEENARAARYSALVEIFNETKDPRLRGDDKTGAIVTAHHAGDQAETMYMRLRRGTTLAGLRGILEERKIPDQVGNDTSSIRIYRPFLNITREELLTYARENKLEWCEDESNADVKFARNRVRHELLPHLEKDNPGATEQLCRLASLADKAYAKVIAKSEALFANAQNGKEMPDQAGNDARSISLDKKKLNSILREHADADLSEMFRLWLSEQGFRFPIGFFYGQNEPAHIKIPTRATYRKRSVVKIGRTVRICEFESPEEAQKFVSCGMKEKGL